MAVKIPPKMPPRMMTGMSRAQMLLRKVRKICWAFCLGREGKSFFLPYQRL